MTDRTTPPEATGADTMLGILEDAGRAGFGAQLIARDEGRVECGACGGEADAATMQIVHVARLEGASDVADELLMLRSRCPACDAGGVLTLGYGPNASSADESVLRVVDLSKADHRPAAAPPVERKPS